MKADVPRYLVPNEAPDIETLKKAFELVFKVCRDKGINRITLLVPAKKNFRHTVVADLLGEKATKALCKGDRVTLNDSIVMELESIQTVQEYSSYEMLFGLYLSRKEIDVLDSIRMAKAIVFLPWLHEVAADWERRWNPMVLGQATSRPPQPQLDPVVEDELKNLTAAINLFTGLSHPMDREHAKRTFFRLRSKRKTFDPNDIKNWAIRNEWHPKDAGELAKLAAKYAR